MPENPKAESPSTQSTLAPGSYFLIIVCSGGFKGEDHDEAGAGDLMNRTLIFILLNLLTNQLQTRTFVLAIFKRTDLEFSSLRNKTGVEGYIPNFANGFLS